MLKKTNKKILFIVFLFFLISLNFVSSYEKGNVLKSATELNYPPFSVTENGIPEGFSVELLTETLKSQGYEVSFYIDEWAAIKKELEIGNLDVLPLVGRTPERESIYDFTVPYISLYGGIFTRNTESITSLEQAKGKVFLTLKGDNSEEFILRENLSDKIISTNSLEEAFTKLNNGEGDLIMAQESIGLKIIKDNNLENIKFSTRINEFKQDFTFAVKEGNSELLSILNEGLSKVITSGKYNEIYEKWFKDIPTSRYSESTVESAGLIKNTAYNSITKKAEETAKEIEIYLKHNPEKTIEDLQKDEYFQTLAVQKVGETGYTAVIDYDTLVMKFHPNPELINTYLGELSRELPEFWSIMSKTRGGKVSEGIYNWKESDGSIKEKYMYIAIVDQKTADGVGLHVAATTYLEDYEKDRQEGVFDKYVKNKIKEQAFEISKKVESYIKSNPEKTIEDLQKDAYFKTIILKPVGKTGYTFAYDCNTLINQFHSKEKFIGIDYNKLKGEPGREGWWELMIPTMNCKSDSEGIYNWVEPDKTIREKYKYTRIIDAKTADGTQLALGVTTYVDEYVDEYFMKKNNLNLNWTLIIILLIGFLIYLFIFPGFDKDKKSSNTFNLSLVILSGLVLLISHTLLKHSLHQETALIFGKFLVISAWMYIIFYSLSLIELSGIKINQKIRILALTSSTILVIFTFFTKKIVLGTTKSRIVGGKIIPPEVLRGDFFIYIIIILSVVFLISIFLILKKAIKEKTKNHSIVAIASIISLILISYLIITEATDKGVGPTIGLQLFPVLTAALLAFIFIKTGQIKRKNNFYYIVIISFIIFAMATLLFNTYQITQNLESMLINHETSSLEAIANSRANHIESYFDQNLERLKLITSRNKLRAELKEYESNPDPKIEQSIKSIINSAKQASEEIERICVMDKNGIVISSTNENFIGKNISENEIFQNALLKEDLKISEEGGIKKIFVSGPLTLENQTIGSVILVTKIDYLESIVKDRNGLMQTGEIIVATNGKNGSISYLFNKLFEEEALSIEKNEETALPMKFALSKREEVLLKTLDYRNKEVVAVSKYIETSDIGLVAKIDIEEVLVPIEEEKEKLWGITLSIALFLLLMGFSFNYFITSSLRKTVKSKTEELNQKVSDLKDTKNALLNMMEDMGQANEDLKKLDKAKSEFLNITSHELKTPLTAMMAYIEILEDSKEKLNKTEKESLETIKRNAHNLKKLIGNILEIARMESGKFELIKTEINLKETVFEAIEDIKILSEKKGLEIVTKIDEKIPTLNMDEERVKEIVNNLVSNSVKFTEKGKITISAKKKAESLELIIEDTGKGIPEEDLKNLFTLFYQVDASISRKHEGTGLGLAITKKIVEAHGGEIKVESQVNKGTKFVINFPLEKIKLK